MNRQKAVFSFRGYCEQGRLNNRAIAAVFFEESEARAQIQVGNKKVFKDDVRVKVTVTVEKIRK